MPLRTRAGAVVEDLFRFSYDVGRVVAIEVDEVPFCVSNDYGDESPCGAPDGTYDRRSPIRRDGLRAALGAGEWVFDAEGRLRAWRDGHRSGRNTFEDGRLIEQHRDEGSQTFTTRFFYDAAERLVLAERTLGDRRDQLRWEYDARGWPTRRSFPWGVVEYDNVYDEDGRLARRTVRSIESPTQSGSTTTFLRRHDAQGLLVEETREPNGQIGRRTTGWERDADGVPVAVSTDGHRIDQSCLQRLARHFH